MIQPPEREESEWAFYADNMIILMSLLITRKLIKKLRVGGKVKREVCKRMDGLIVKYKKPENIGFTHPGL